MSDWINNINTGELDYRFAQAMNKAIEIEKLVPEEQRKNYYADLRDSMEIRRKMWTKRKKLFGIF